MVRDNSLDHGEDDSSEDIFDKFLDDRGHSVNEKSWEQDYNKKKCPECFAVHKREAESCSVCGWNDE